MYSLVLVSLVKYGFVIQGVLVLGISLHRFSSGSGDICLVSYITVFGVLVFSDVSNIVQSIACSWAFAALVGGNFF